MNNLLQYLKEQKDPIMERILREKENTLARGRMDLPLSLRFAVIRGDELLLHKLLKRGLDPNESDSSGHTALHLVASKGSESCVLLLLDYGADSNSQDSAGSVPLWEAVLGKHESVIKMLMDNGAALSCGDVAQFACTAAEQNNIDLLKDIINYGGDVRLPRKDGSTALHLAVCEGNLQMVKLLLEHGADIDKHDMHGWSPRGLAEQQDHQEIILLFQTKKVPEEENSIASGKEGDSSGDQKASTANRSLGKFRSEPSMVRELQQGMYSSCETASTRVDQKNNSRSFGNSLFGIMSAAHADNSGSCYVKTGFGNYPDSHHQQVQQYYHGHNHHAPFRITISCPEKRDSACKLVILPRSIEEILWIGDKKFGFQASKVVTKDGVEIDDLQLIRDGDHLLLVSDLWRGRNGSIQ